MLEFDWDEENTEHIARHGITPADAAYVLLHGTMDLGMQDWHMDEERFAEVGATPGGRMVVVVTTWRGRKIRVVTVYDAPRQIAAAYLRTR